MYIDIENYNLRDYEIFSIDPPWPQEKGGIRKCRPNQGRELDYSTMELGDIETLLKNVLINSGAPIHTVFLWEIDKYLIEAELMMQRLGYRRHARIVWDKLNGPAPAMSIRFTHEYLVWYYKPKFTKPVKEMQGKETSVIREASRGHSIKPVKAYEYIEALFSAQKKIELFARNHRMNWDCWGDEVPDSLI